MQQKRVLLLLSLPALLALVLLISGLRGVEFRPGRPLSRGTPISLPAPLSRAAEGIQQVPGWKQALFLVLLVLNVVLFAFLLPPEMRRRLIINFIRFTLTVGVLLYLIQNHYLELPGLNPASDLQAGAADAADLGAARPVFQPPHLAAWLDILVTLSAALALMALFAVVYRWWRRLYYRRTAGPSLTEIAAIAQDSLGDLAAGREWGDVIIRSYVRMSSVVSDQRGINRAEAMTPREFADRLEAAGLPGEAVQRLTRLFESARYGARPSSSSEGDEAAACLTSILKFCGAAS